ncbi:unnamed protein product [Durusdinium trenchii]|uniref:Protein kinase domain-containing protein n=1 Tax=Durusdinium trenchii TaxID=1381693 RepID=A0ABP0HBT5_9DINO
MPTAALHLVVRGTRCDTSWDEASMETKRASLAGLVPFSMGYAVAKHFGLLGMWSCAGGRLADSSSFRVAGCYGSWDEWGELMGRVDEEPILSCFRRTLEGDVPTAGEGANDLQRRSSTTRVASWDLSTATPFSCDADGAGWLTPLLVANHVSYLDALILPLVLKLPKFLSMSSVKSWPLFGSLGEDLEYIWVNSWKVGERPLVIFPEGTTSNGQSLYPFKQGPAARGDGRANFWTASCRRRLRFIVFHAEHQGERVEYTDGEWAMNFWANLFHSCTVLVCEQLGGALPPIDGREGMAFDQRHDGPQADPELYASNVRAFMLEKQKELEFQSCSGAAGPIVDPSAPIPIPVDPSTHRGRQIGVSQLFVYPDEPSVGVYNSNATGIDWLPHPVGRALDRRLAWRETHCSDEWTWSRALEEESSFSRGFRQKVRPRRRTALMDEAKEQEQIDHRCDPVADPIDHGFSSIACLVATSERPVVAWALEAAAEDGPRPTTTLRNLLPYSIPRRNRCAPNSPGTPFCAAFSRPRRFLPTGRPTPKAATSRPSAMGAASSSEACAEDPLRTEPVPGVTAWCSRSDEATPSSSGTSGRFEERAFFPKTCPSLQLSEQPTTCSAGGTSVRGTASLDTRCAERPFERSGELKEKGLLIDVEEVVLEKEICSTFTSKIYVARWHERLVAAKEVKRSLFASGARPDLPIAVRGALRLDSTSEKAERQMEGLMHEVQILSKINHPSLLQLVGASLDISSPMMLTELMLKQDVETYMLQQSLRCLNGFWRPSFCLALHWAASTAQGLAYLHERDLPIVHRDLKPLNMFLTKDLEVKLGDFGLAMEMPRGTKLPGKMGLQGTWRYMAPEVARKEDFDEKVDIYAFSLILYYIFSGRQPFHTFQDPRKASRRARFWPPSSCARKSSDSCCSMPGTPRPARGPRPWSAWSDSAACKRPR